MRNPRRQSTLLGAALFALLISLSGCSSSDSPEDTNSEADGDEADGDTASADQSDPDAEGDTARDTATSDERDSSDAVEPDAVADSTPDAVPDGSEPDESDADGGEPDVVPDETTDVVEDVVADESTDTQTDTGESCQPGLAVQDDGGGADGAVGLPDLVISEVRPAEYIELFNTTDGDIDLSGTTHAFCSPFLYADLADLHAPGEDTGSVTVPAGGFATIQWPITPARAVFLDDSDGGAILLYSVDSFSTDTAILDFVCWGSPSHSTRKDQAEAVSKWDEGADCAPVLTNGSIHRLANTTGDGAASYDVTGAASPSNCTP